MIKPLPGDRIQMIHGVLNINGVPVKQEALPNYVDDEGGGSVRRWRETLPNGVSYTTLDLYDNGTLDNTDVFTVPLGHYFMMGDNHCFYQLDRQPRPARSTWRRLRAGREPDRPGATHLLLR